MLRKISLFVFVITIFSCAGPRETIFNTNIVPFSPDYGRIENWAALPFTVDLADRTPEQLKDNQQNAKVDVFFIHPTTFTSKRDKNQWNANLNDQKLNKKTDESSIQYQSSALNGTGKVYAPRYRQAHLNSYYTRDTVSAEKAFDIAYSDVKAAFEYFIKTYSNGRPFIIAAHSQGTQHGARLIKEMIDGKPLQENLIVAYLVGMPIPKDYYESLKVCETPDESECFCSWRSFKRGYIPPYHENGANIAITNPLNWSVKEEKVDRSLNEGAVYKNFKIRPASADAEIHDGLLWMDRPKFPFSFLMTTKNYHVGDYNLFYVNIRNNAIVRTKSYLHKISQAGH